MIMAFDEDAWHPSGLFLLLVSVLAVAALIPLFQLAARGPRDATPYVASALPFVAAFAFIAYFDFGNSASYSGDGTLGFGGHIDLLASLRNSLPYSILFAPNLLLLGLGHWTWLRSSVPLLFWPVFAVGMILQILFALAFQLAWFER